MFHQMLNFWRTLELTQNEVDNMVTKFNNNNGLSKAV